MKSTSLLLLFAFMISFYSDTEIKQFQFFPKNVQEECTQIISGKIINKKTNSPISNALITLYLDGQDIKIEKTNSQGEYSLKLNCDTNYRIEVSASNFFKADFLIKTSSQNNTNLTHNFFLEYECYQTITGKVINELTKDIVHNATLTLYLDGEKIETQKVNDSGEYNFKIRCNTNYYIIADKTDYINDLYEFTSSTTDNENINHDFILEPECIQTISGTIRNKVTKEPLSAEIKLYLNNIEAETIKVNNDGSYFIKFQCTTNYRIIATKPNYIDDSYNFLTDYIEYKQPDYFHLKKDLFLEPNLCYQVVLGKVFDKKTNEVVTDALVSLLHQNNEITTFQTSYDGSYFFKIKCALDYELKVTKEGMLSKIINYKASAIKGDNKTQNIYIESEACNQIVNGSILDKETKLPLANTQVTLFENDNEVNKITTDNNGAFSFNIKCENTYKIVADNNEYNSNTITFETDKKRDISISKTLELTKLDCNQIVNGSILDKETKLPLANTQVTLFENNNEVNKITTDNNGAFSFNIKCENTYKIVADNNEYNSNTITFETDKKRDISISKTL
ncbi:carboxypeptidase regulatory-like domain-containing protein, partial [Lutibacter sp. B1]|uniref:carboxypeptidase regulatory-like domain-containing protein n=1 Tax=Lutibacter sp. B1 TaxID=2725996 RepID=UPI0014568791